ncbi:adipose-secreted signaling protein isoform X2 [Sardina pilchardus]|uniref:adipose-secreted signaling protein isoform X2 n=1 Tax=Sardina pilchardus TaxID=27697 RepID=UPI002E1421CD
MADYSLPSADMATERKGSTSKGGGVHFTDQEDASTGPECSDETRPDRVISATPESDGTYLVKVGFLRSQHRYEIAFNLPQVPSMAKDATLSPALRTSAKPRLRATRITPRQEGGMKVVCEYSTQQEGVLQEELTLVNRSRRDGSVRVKLQARVMDRHHGTPQLMEGVRCIGPEKEANSKQTDRKKI